MKERFYSWFFRPATKQEIAEAKKTFEEFQAMFATPKPFIKAPYYILELKITANDPPVYRLVSQDYAHEILKQFLHMTEER